MTEQTGLGVYAEVLNNSTPEQEFNAIEGLLPADANRTRNAITRALANTRAEVNGTVHAVGQLRANDMIPKDARDRLIAERFEQAERVVDEQIRNADAATTILDAQLSMAALAPVGDAFLARADAQMILDNTPPARLDEVMARLARRQDDVGALVASPWARDYLAARGVEPDLVDAIHTGVVESHVDAQTGSSDSGRAAAARHRQGIVHLRQARDVVFNTARMMLEELRGA
ncbi:MAG TPA: hypothetical protein VGF29_00605 [Hyphomicrobiaceae bacterium]|jgi:hypothetical protein